jgi:hypothetical protein
MEVLMAESTHTVAQIGVPTIEGQKRYQRLLVDITAAKADGVNLVAGNDGDGLSGFSRIEGVRVLAQENGGYVCQFVATTMPSYANPTTSLVGALRVYEAGADAAVLDEVVGDEDAGEFLIEVMGV